MDVRVGRSLRDVAVAYVLARAAWAAACVHVAREHGLWLASGVFVPADRLATLSPADWWSAALLRGPEQYDADMYVEAARGAIPQAAAFLPGTQLLFALGVPLGVDPLITATVLSFALPVAALVAFHQLVGRDLGEDVARRATWWLLALPPSFVLMVPYSEAPFVLAVVLALLAARSDRFVAAAVAAAAATLLRQTGVLLLPGLALAAWTRARGIREGLTSVGTLAAVPVAMLAGLELTSLLNLGCAQRDVAALLSLPSRTQAHWDGRFAPPWTSIAALACRASAGDPHAVVDAAMGAVLAAGCVGALVVWRPPEVRGWVALNLLVSLTLTFADTASSPSIGLGRHLLVALGAPVALAVLFRRLRLLELHLIAVAGLLGILAFVLYLRRCWIP